MCQIICQQECDGRSSETRHAALARLQPVELTSVETLTVRWDRLSDRQLHWLLDRMIDPLAERLAVAAPPVDDRLRGHPQHKRLTRPNAGAG